MRTAITTSSQKYGRLNSKKATKVGFEKSLKNLSSYNRLLIRKIARGALRTSSFSRLRKLAILYIYTTGRKSHGLDHRNHQGIFINGPDSTAKGPSRGDGGGAEMASDVAGMG